MMVPFNCWSWNLVGTLLAEFQFLYRRRRWDVTLVRGYLPTHVLCAPADIFAEPQDRSRVTTSPLVQTLVLDNTMGLPIISINGWSKISMSSIFTRKLIPITISVNIFTVFGSHPLRYIYCQHILFNPFLYFSGLPFAFVSAQLLPTLFKHPVLNK